MNISIRVTIRPDTNRNGAFSANLAKLRELTINHMINLKKF